jgi:hypothetical protein
MVGKSSFEIDNKKKRLIPVVPAEQEVRVLVPHLYVIRSFSSRAYCIYFCSAEIDFSVVRLVDEY